MCPVESTPEQDKDKRQPTLLRTIGGVSLISLSCVGLAANIYVVVEELPPIPRITLSIFSGLMPLSGLREKKTS